VPESIPEARRAVVELAIKAGADTEAVEAIRLATSEAVTNAVLYAYDGPPGPIHLTAAAVNGSIAVTVADEGAGVRPRLDRRGIGIGLALIAQAADELAIAKRPGGGTEIQMSFSRVSSRR
jgi:anti-sigma regulatory factor (Ser/Thr protein kinase)